MRELRDRVAVVTGAASGIGRATARALADAGCRLALVDVDAERLDALAAELNAASAGSARSWVTDVSDRDQMRALPQAITDAFGAIHIVVNNAGVSVQGSFAQQSEEDWDRLMGINLWGVVYGCRYFLPHLLEADAGHVVNISSIFGIVGVPNQSSYCASKFAVRGLSESLRAELRGTNVGVTVVHPGAIDTSIVEATRYHDPEVMGRARTLFTRFGSPPEAVARAIVRAIRRDRFRVLVTIEARLGDLLKRAAPTLLPLALGAAMARMVARARAQIVEVERSGLD